MTEGILLRRLAGEPDLRDFDCIVLDEVRLLPWNISPSIAHVKPRLSFTKKKKSKVVSILVDFSLIVV
jgi:hypothetical protein